MGRIRDEARIKYLAFRWNRSDTFEEFAACFSDSRAALEEELEWARPSGMIYERPDESQREELFRYFHGPQIAAFDLPGLRKLACRCFRIKKVPAGARSIAEVCFSVRCPVSEYHRLLFAGRAPGLRGSSPGFGEPLASAPPRLSGVTGFRRQIRDNHPEMRIWFKECSRARKLGIEPPPNPFGGRERKR